MVVDGGIRETSHAGMDSPFRLPTKASYILPADGRADSLSFVFVLCAFVQARCVYLMYSYLCGFAVRVCVCVRAGLFVLALRLCCVVLARRLCCVCV